MSGRARTAVRKAFKAGMTAEVSHASQANLGSDSAFRSLYESTMSRVGASSHHVYGDSYYSTLLSRLSDRVFVVNVATYEGKPAASAMILLDGAVVHYHLSGSDPQAAKSGANNLLLWTILEWSALQSFGSVHLGGGLSADDSLFRFKESFGGASRDFWVGRAVIDQDRYVELASMRAESLGVTVTQLKSGGFFPTFRAGL
jgi:lipid II:glycine glycyltransferase (peptidoglycan interpeptide bridge formation enzyme)